VSHGYRAQRVLEEGVPAQRFNGVEVGFAGAQQADIGLEQAVLVAMPPWPEMGKRGSMIGSIWAKRLRYCPTSDNPACAVRL